MNRLPPRPTLFPYTTLFRSRMPRRLRRRRLLTGPEKRAIAARLAAGGEPLVAALDALDAVATRVREASVLDKAAHAEWQGALRTPPRRLQAAWLPPETQGADRQRRWARGSAAG